MPASPDRDAPSYPSSRRVAIWSDKTGTSVPPPEVPVVPLLDACGITTARQRAPKRRILIVARYLLVDDRDGSVLAQLAGPQQAMRLFVRLARRSPGGPPVSVVRTDSEESELVQTTSIVSVRPLQPLVARRRTETSPDRRGAHRSSPRPPLPLR